MTSAANLQQPLNGNKMKSILTIAFTFLILLASAQERMEQEQEIDLKVHQINGKEYYIHVVEAGNTLYAISRRYAIPVEKLKAENPRLTQELTIGDRLLIPLDEVKRRDLESSPDIDGNFLIHEVQKKNTLYSIAKEYNVEINDIIAQNPAVEDGLKKGMKIRIPVAEIKSETNTEYIQPAAASPYVTHEVLPKETLYSLSKKYEVSIDSLLSVNNGLTGGLRVNQLINIPILKDYIDTNFQKVEFDSSAIKPTYKVVLMLPFYLNLMEQAEDSSMTYKASERLNKQLYQKAQYAIEFYQGFKMAADSLVKQGLNLELSVLDTENDSVKMQEILKDSSLQQADLIVGPFFLKNFQSVADFAKEQNINIVSPVKLSNKILLGNKFVSKVTTSSPILLKYLGKYMHDSLRTENLLMVYPDQFKDRRRAEVLKKEYYNSAQNSEDSSRISSIKEVYWNSKEFWQLKSKLDTSQTNCLVVPSDDQAFVTNLLTKLSLLEDYRFKVFGLQAWENYDNIEVNYLQALNVHLVVTEYTDEQSKDVIAFNRRFMESYQMVPDQFAFLGFDVGYYYLQLMKEYGINFEVMFAETQQELLSRKFNLIKTGIESGYENHSTYLIRYKDYRKERVD